MAVRYYDDAILLKLKKWLPESRKLRVLRPEETKRLFELTAEDNRDQEFTLPLIALSRNNDIQLLQTTKSHRTFNGVRLNNNRYNDGGNIIVDNRDATAVLNSLPIKVQYQLDVYTKFADEADEYIRELVFKLINNPKIYIEVPYNNNYYKHIANIRILDGITDTSDITERIFSGQFSRWTIQFEIQDAFLFSIPYKDNWRIIESDLDVDDSGIEEVK